MTEVTAPKPEPTLQFEHKPSTSDLRVSQIFVARSNFRWRSFKIDREPSAAFVPNEDGVTMKLNLRVKRGGITIRMEGHMDFSTGNLSTRDTTRPGKKFPRLIGAMYAAGVTGGDPDFVSEELTDEEGG